MHKWLWLVSLAMILIIGIAVWLPGASFSLVNQRVSQLLSTTPAPVEANLLFVGDMMLTRSVGIKIHTAGKDDFTFPFKLAAPQLQPYDLVFGNLETTISTRGTKVGSIYSFRSNPAVVAGLKLANFSLVNIANNHIWDYSRQAFLDTLDNLTTASISYVGGGRNFDEAHKGVVKIVKGTRIAFLGYTDLLSKQLSATTTQPGISWAEPEQIKQDIVVAKTHADLVVVTFHFGTEYQPIHSAHQAELAYAAIDAGADLVVGHHPHVVEDLEQYRGKWIPNEAARARSEPLPHTGWIAYSLGNFVFDQFFSPATMQGGALQVKLKAGKIDSVKLIPVIINQDYQPSLKENRN